MNKRETDFLLDRFDDLIEKVVKAEVRRREIKEELDFIKQAFMAHMKRPANIVLTDQQVDRIVHGLSQHIAEIMMSGGEVH